MKAPTYKVRKIQIDKLIHYHVVNIATNVTQSQWRSLPQALTTMRDLNASAFRDRSKNADLNRAVRS